MQQIIKLLPGKLIIFQQIPPSLDIALSGRGPHLANFHLLRASLNIKFQPFGLSIYRMKTAATPNRKLFCRKGHSIENIHGEEN